MQETVDKHRSRALVELVLYRFAALRDLDDDVDVLRRLAANADLGEIHSGQSG
jgi:hypothetical protein